MNDLNLLLTDWRYAAPVQFWTERFGDVSEYFSFQGYRPRADLGPKRFETLDVALPDAAACALRQPASSALGCFVVLGSALTLLLSRYTNRQQVVVKTPLLREYAEGELFVEEVALVVDLAACRTGRDLLQAFKETVEKSYEHQMIPADRLLDRQTGLNFYRVSNILLSVPTLHRDFAGARDFDLGIEAEFAPDSVHLRVRYNSDQFEHAFLTHFFSHLVCLLVGLARRNVPLKEVAFLGETQAEELCRWSAGEADPRIGAEGWLARFEEQVRAAPAAVAVRAPQQAVTYAELNTAANQLARHWQKNYGLKPGDLVGIHLHPSLELVTSVLAALKARCAFLPLDPGSPPKRNELILSEAQTRLLVTEGDFLFELGDYQCPVFSPALDASYRQEDTDDPGDHPGPAELAYVMYTSGSAGAPKGVAVEHGSLALYTDWACRRYPAADGGHMPLFTSPAFDLSLTSLFCPLARGSTVSVFGPADVAETLRRIFAQGSGLDLIKLTPSHLSMLQHLGVPRSDVRCLIVGGEALTPEHVEVARRLNPGVRIFNEYGPTEATVGCTVAEVTSLPVTIGQPIANTFVYVLDRDLSLLPAGAVGEICIAGRCLARGYLNSPEQTARAFVSNPHAGGERLYRTGDLGRWSPEGELEYLGRADEQIKYHGHRIEAAEIEGLLRRVPGVRRCVVEKRRTRHGEDCLVAYYVAGAPIPAYELRGFLAQYLVRGVIPSHFVHLPKLALTLNGKLNRQMLPDPEPADGTPVGFEAPRGPVEERVAAVWCEVFGIERVGARDNFFDLGGHSLKAVKLASRLYREFALSVTITDIFNRPTVRQLARQLSHQDPQRFVRVEPAPAQADYELSAAQKRLWVLAQRPGAGPAYHIPASFELVGPLDVPALERAFAVLVRRHEALRTSFLVREGEPRQRIAPEASLEIPVHDLRGVEERESRAGELAEEEARAPFDLGRDPLLRVRLMQTADATWVLLFTAHHLIFDGWSIGVLIGELAALYRAFTRGEPDALPPPPVQYKDYLAWQNEAIRSGRFDLHRERWRSALADAPPPFRLSPSPTTPSAATGLSVRWDKETTRRLRHFCREEGFTPTEFFISQLGLAYRAQTGESRFLLNLAVAARNHVDLEGLVGLMMNVVLVNVETVPEDSFRNNLRRLHATLLEELEVEHYPFEILLEELRELEPLVRRVSLSSTLSLEDTTPRLEGVEIRPFRTYRNPTPRTDLTLILEGVDRGMELRAIFHPRHHDADTLRQFLDGLRQLVTQSLEAPDRPVKEHEWLARADRRMDDLTRALRSENVMEF